MQNSHFNSDRQKGPENYQKQCGQTGLSIIRCVLWGNSMDKGDKAVKYRPLRGYFVLAQNIAWYFATNAVCCYDMSTMLLSIGGKEFSESEKRIFL